MGVGFLADNSFGFFVLDPIAARRGEAPLFFSRLRRLQIPIVLLALAVSTAISTQM